MCGGVMWECVCICGQCCVSHGGKTFHIPLGSQNRALCEVSQSLRGQVALVTPSAESQEGGLGMPGPW